MKRLFLILLVLTLILISAAVQGAANAFPGGEEKFLNLVPYWDVRVAIPCGVFAAGEVVAAMGVVAQLLLSIRRMAGNMDKGVDYRLQQLILCSLWCGWTLLACCTTGLAYVIPGLGTPAAYPMGYYSYFVAIGAGVMLLCQVLNIFLRKWASILPGLLAVALGVAASYLWHDGYTEFHVLGALAMVAGFSVRQMVALWPEGKVYIIPAVAGIGLASVYVLHLTEVRGREVDTAMIAVFAFTLVLAAGLSVARLLR